MHESNRSTSAARAASPNELLTVELRLGVYLLAGEIDACSSPIFLQALRPLDAIGGHVRVNARQVTLWALQRST